ncbi:hypothetical protein BGX30_007003, partial [Mortierella sp. GBA39]
MLDELEGDEQDHLYAIADLQSPVTISTMELPSPALSATTSSAHHDSNGIFAGAAGTIANAFAIQGKRTRDEFSKDELERQVCKILVHHKLPYTFGESKFLSDLLRLAHAAPSVDDLKIPSNDTFARRMAKQHYEYDAQIRKELEPVSKVAFTLDGWTSPFQ